MSEYTFHEFATGLGPLQLSESEGWVHISATEGTEEATMSFSPEQARSIAATLVRLGGEAERGRGAA